MQRKRSNRLRDIRKENLPYFSSIQGQGLAFNCGQWLYDSKEDIKRFRARIRERFHSFSQKTLIDRFRSEIPEG